MKLRPHHLLCIQKFTGHGYDEVFTKHMTAIVNKLPGGVEITLHKGCDDVCVACPHNQNGKCVSLEKVDKLDQGVLNACNLSFGQTGMWKDFADKANELILTTKEFDSICGDCQWYSLCKDTKEETWITQVH